VSAATPFSDIKDEEEEEEGRMTKLRVVQGEKLTVICSVLT
jgi:hypothetical protein